MNDFYDIRGLKDEEIKNAFIKCFEQREGKIVLSFLKRMTQERYLGPECTNEQLRHLEGQRYLFGYICSQCKK